MQDIASRSRSIFNRQLFNLLIINITSTGFITFDSPAAAQKALAMTGQELMGRAIRCELAKPRNAAAGGRKPGKDFQLSPKPEGCTTVFAGQLSYTIDEESVREFFKDCGEISAIRWLNDRETGEFKGCAFVEFNDTSAVDLAIAKQGSVLAGRPIRLDYASSKPKKEF
jgi:nucleolin